jgi:simple sugar transport system ATP-binding protein
VTVAPALELRGIVKRFGRVTALAGVDLVIAREEVHALLGENGAGKSTLMHVAAGMTAPDAGVILRDGIAVRLTSPRHARAAGVGLVHQHFTSIPSMTVAENVALAAGWEAAGATLGRRVAALSLASGLPLEPAALVRDLGVQLEQRLEIVKALATDAKILLLDEPTAVLAPAEADELARMVRAFAARGNSVVLITHKLDEALAMADRITVLRRGTVVWSGAARDATRDLLAQAMIGGGGEALELAGTGQPVVPANEIRITAEGLTVLRSDKGTVAVRAASLVVRAGEIVGVAGVEGNGQRELLRAVAGRLPQASGRLEVAEPVGFVPEDRTTEGLVGEMSLTENLVLGLADDARWRAGAWIRWPAARRRAAELIDIFRVRADGSEVPARTLSGGNQQKLIIARALEMQPRVLVAEQPTRGLDIGAAADVHARLRAAAASGAAVLFSSSDLDEVVALATRVVVAVQGRLLEMQPAADRAAIGAAMLGERA